MAVYTDFMIVCGLSVDGTPVNGKETDWYHFGLPVRSGEIWEFQFQCYRDTSAPVATVIGSFVMYDRNGTYIGTTPGPVANLSDVGNTWTRYTFQQQFNNDLYVFPAIWWHAATALVARYLAGIQVAQVKSAGAVTVIRPDVFLTLGATGHTLGGTQAILGPDR
jgi:hypothetical protein